MSTDFDGLFDDVRGGVARLRAVATQQAKQARRNLEAGHRLMAKVDQLEDDIGAKLHVTLSEQDISACLRAGSELDGRTQRWVATNWNKFALDDLRLFVQTYSRLIPRIRTGILANFVTWLNRIEEERHALIAAVAAYEADADDSMTGAGFQELAAPGGPSRVAADLIAADDPYGQALGDRGIRPTWAFASLVRWELLKERLDDSTPRQVLAEIRDLAAPSPALWVPPPRHDKTAADRFFAQAAAIPIVATWLHAAADSVHDAARIDDFLLDALGDPGAAADQSVIRWSELKRRSLDDYEALLARITRSDIEFFFNNAEGDDAEERGQFWLGYLRQIRRTKSYLGAEERTRLKPLADGGSDDSYKRALKRAGRLNDAPGTSVFVLWFERVVIVEFSKTGNASYVYDRTGYQSLGLVEQPDVRDFKNQKLGTRMLHQGAWKEKFVTELNRRGIVPDTQRGRR